ncbi:ABC transporter permease [Kribbella sp. NPDC051586]|uniref:ABC transporter permease n=1 Tax=Kribbella sp. NPDC051586 TaxID=3364118 RepID=UPI003795B9D9
MSRTEVHPRAAAAAVTAEEPTVDQAGKARRKYRLIRLVSILVVLGAWELVGRQINPLFMSYPTAVVRAAVQMTKTGELPKALLSSLSTLALGFAIAAVLGVVLGLVIGRYKTVEVATDWLVNALYATPLVAVVPLVILWFGLGFSAKLFVVVLLAIFPVLINTASGVRNVPAALIDVGTGFAASEWQVFTKVILPASLPYTMTGLRLGVGRAIIGMVVAEFFTAITGLGALVVKYGNQFDTASMLVPVLVLMVLGVALTAGLRQAEARIAPWKETER